MHGVTAGGQVIGEFSADQARADQRDRRFFPEGGAKFCVIIEIVDRHHAVGAVAAGWQTDLVGAERDHQF